MGPDKGESSSTPPKSTFPSESDHTAISSQGTYGGKETMAGDEDSYKIQKFTGKASDDYNTWRLRAIIALKGKGYWKQLEKEKCTEEVKEKAAALLVNALGDSPLRVCSSSLDDPITMIELLDARYASDRAVSRISVLTSLYSKKYNSRENMAKYIDEFEVLFNQLEKMGNDTKVPESHKAPLLLSSMGHDSQLESTVAALRLRDVDQLTWESVTADLIQEYQQSKETKKHSKHSAGLGHRNNNSNRRHTSSKGESSKGETCTFCGNKGHSEIHCFYNPDSERCRVPEQAREKLKAMKTKDSKGSSKKEKKKLHFGSTGVVKRNSKTQSTGKLSANAAAIEDDVDVLDSGASTTMFKEISEAVKGTYRKGSKESVQLAAGSTDAGCLGKGTIMVGSIPLVDSIHVQNLNNTLYSVGQICDNDKIVVFTKENGVILNLTGFTVDSDNVIAIAKRNSKGSGLYEFNGSPKHSSMAVKSSPSDINLWHNRLIHVNKKVLHSLNKLTRDVPKMTGTLTGSCHPCLLGKGTHKTFDSTMKSTTYAGEIVHSDLAGPLPKSHDGRRYFITFVDQFTRYSHVMGLTAKNEAVEAVKLYKETTHVKRYFKRGITQLHSDGGGEYFNADIEEKTQTTPDTPQHNPFAERLNRTYMDPVRTLLEQAGLSAKYWEYAIDHVAYVKNRLPHSALICSPYEALTGRKPTLKHVRVFGCAAFVYNEEPKSKAHAKAFPGIYLGCDDNGVYMVEMLNDKRLINSVHVSFDEDSFPGLHCSDSSSSGESQDTFRSDIELEDNCDGIDEPFPDVSSEELNHSTSSKGNSSADESEKAEPKRYPSRSRNAPERLGQSHTASSAIMVPITTTDSPTVQEAMSATESEVELWKTAIDDEITSLEEMGTWKIVTKRTVQNRKNSNEPVLPTHVILKIKRNSEGVPERFKARIVAGGNLQISGRDVDDVYSPVVDYSIVLLTLAVSNQLGWFTRHVDVKSAFLNGNIDREVFVSHPYNLPDKMKRSRYYKLMKALYGLRQAPLQWFIKLKDTLTLKFKFQQLKTDGSVYKKITKNGDETVMILVLCYVDDLIFLGNDDRELDFVIEEFLKVFQGTINPLEWYLSIRIHSYDDIVEYSQKAYIEEALKEYGLCDVTKRFTPMITHFHDEMQAHKMDELSFDDGYRKMIGTLQFLANRTRPDISTAVAILSQYVHSPNAFLIKSVKRIFGYLKQTIDYCLVHEIKTDGNVELMYYCDSDFAGDKADRKSRNGSIGYLNNSVFYWSSRKQTSVATSTSEAEYISMSECAKRIALSKQYLAEIGLDMSSAIALYGDNVAAQAWSSDSTSMRKAKHIEVRYHYIRQKVSDNTIVTQDIATSENMADFFTKPLDRTKFEPFRNKIGVKLSRRISHQEEC